MENAEEELFKDIAVGAFESSETPLEKLEILAFSAGVSVNQAIINLVWGADEAVARQALAAILVGWLTSGQAQMTLNVMGVLSSPPEAWEL